MHLLYVITHTIIKNSNLKIKHQNMFKYPKSANSLGKIKKMLLQQQQQQQHKHGGQGNFKFSILCILWKIDNKNTNKKNVQWLEVINKIKQRPLKT